MVLFTADRKGGGQEEEAERFYSLFQAIHTAVPLEFKIFRPSITKHVIWSGGDLQSRWGRHFTLITQDEWRQTNPLHSA